MIILKKVDELRTGDIFVSGTTILAVGRATRPSGATVVEITYIGPFGEPVQGWMDPYDRVQVRSAPVGVSVRSTQEPK